jgi:hypothetical protein
MEVTIVLWIGVEVCNQSEYPSLSAFFEKIYCHIASWGKSGTLEKKKRKFKIIFF